MSDEDTEKFEMNSAVNGIWREQEVHLQPPICSKRIICLEFGTFSQSGAYKNISETAGTGAKRMSDGDRSKGPKEALPP